MARFYFHLHDDVDVPDNEGRELPDLEAARECATREARNCLAETIKEKGRLVLHRHIDIVDERGEVLETVRFGDTVQIEY